MNFGMIMLNQNIKTMQNYVIWILTALLFVLKPKGFMKILHMMLKKDAEVDRPLPKGKNKKVIGSMND